MRVISRLVMIVALLGGLAYGSYSFGRYVLSTRLFGTSVSPAKGSNFSLNSSSRVDRAVTRRTTLKGQSRVELEVLPANEAGPGPEPPSISNMERETKDKGYVSSTPPRTRVITPKNFRAPRLYGREGGNDDIDISSSRQRSRRDGSRFSNRDGEERPRRRRRRRRRTASDNSTFRSSTVRSQRTEAASSDDSARSSSDDSSGADSSGADSSGSDRRSGRRERTRESSSDAPRRETPRRRERSESPVPRAEGGGSSDGGESPIPQPE